MVQKVPFWVFALSSVRQKAENGQFLIISPIWPLFPLRLLFFKNVNLLIWVNKLQVKLTYSLK